MTYAWREQYLDINLTSGEMTVKRIPRDLIEETIGGVGLAAQVVYEQVPAGAEPLSPENVLFFAAGVLSGTTWAGTGRLGHPLSQRRVLWAQEFIELYHMGPDRLPFVPLANGLRLFGNINGYKVASPAAWMTSAPWTSPQSACRSHKYL